jgi:hypothetical protein
MRLITLYRLAGAALVLGLAGCGRDALAPADESRFAATVTGALSRRVTGSALGGRALLGTEVPEYDLLLTDGTTGANGLYFYHAGYEVAPGAYGIGSMTTGSASSTPAQFIGSYFASTGPDQSDIYYTTGGSLTVESISTTRISGRFDVTMVTMVVGAPAQKTVRVVGTFDGPSEANVAANDKGSGG